MSVPPRSLPVTHAAEPGSVFVRVLEKYFAGEEDAKMLRWLDQQKEAREG